jgi:hypothetical protein
MMDSSRTIAEFWRSFQECAAALASAESVEHPAHDALLEKLHAIHPGLYLEFCLDPGGCELIVTADGNRALFPLVHAIVDRAPAISGWTMKSLKPKFGFPNTVSWDDLTIVIDHVVFDPIEKQGSDELGLRIFVPGLKKSEADKAYNAILRALDHGLGEQKLAEAVRYTEVLPLPHDVVATDFIPLVELENFIRWRDERRKATAGHTDA